MKSVIKLLILSDIFLVTGFGFISPILAIFIKDNLIGGTIASAGIASAIFMLIKSIGQIAVAKKFNPKDRIPLLLSGTFFIALVPFIYAYSTQIWQLYLAQVLYGIGAALSVPAFMNVFILNVSRKKPGLEWSIYSTLVGFGSAVAAFLGAQLANTWGFRPVFFLNGALAMIGAMILLKLNTEKIK